MTETEHRVWWAANTIAPYGLCWCGCGESTALSKYNKRSKGQTPGCPLAYVRGHHNRTMHDVSHLPEPNPSGLCMCGCGGSAPIAKQTSTAEGWVRGKPIRYLPGHRNRVTIEPPNSSGVCMCGCGAVTPLAGRSDANAGTVKGEHVRYLRGHSGHGNRPMTEAEHKAWWAGNTEAPYGLCFCGCGEITPIATYTNKEKGYARGRPVTFLRGHAASHKSRIEAEQLPEPNPSGLCMCGCGEATPFARQSKTSGGWVRGKPIPYIQGHVPSKLTTAQEAEAARLYIEDRATSSEIGKIFGVSHKTVTRVLESLGIDRDASTRRWTEERLASHRTYDCDHSFFETIDNETKAYWLGFLAADGCNTAGFMSVSASSVDHDHLLRFKCDLRSGHPVYRRVNKKTGQSFGKGEGSTSSFAIRSPKLTASLAAHGVVPRKTFVLKWPGFLRPDLLRHYLRGYSDGDGCFHVAWSRYVRKSDGGTGQTVNWMIVGNRTFLLGAQGFLVQQIGVRRLQLSPSPNSRPEIMQLRYGGNRQMARLAHLLYDNATVYLPRKRDKVAHLL